MLTKEQFLNSTEFTINGIGNYKFIPPNDEDETIEGSIHRVHRAQKDNRVVLTDYEANVSKVTNNSFTFYTTVLGEIIQKRVMFNNLIVADVTEKQIERE